MTKTVKWYHFWMNMGYRGLKKDSPDYETYRQLNDTGNEHTNTSNAQDIADDWAEITTAGAYDSYEYDFKEVEKPPKEWLEKEIQKNINAIKYRNDINDVYTKVLNTYQLNEKIEKIKNNIK